MSRPSCVVVILVRQDGAILLQQRDTTPGIQNPGLVSAFGGAVESGETPLQAAVRELQEETNLSLAADRLEKFGFYRKTAQVHGQDCDVYCFIARDIDATNLEVYEGQGFVAIQSLQEFSRLKASILTQQLMTDFYTPKTD